MMPRVQLRSVAAVLPARVRTSVDVEALIARSSPCVHVRRGIIEAMTGIRARRVAEDDVQCSDLAVDASRKALRKAALKPHDIDLLIFAAAGQDLIEPATAHIVQQKLGTQCPVFDVKNACNSFLNGLQLAESLILSGTCATALVTTGEVCSRAINWHLRDLRDFRRSFPGYTMGDAGAAAILTRSENGRGIAFRGFEARSDHWHLATIPVGGSMHPRGDDIAYLQGDGTLLKEQFVTFGPAILDRMMSDAGVGFASIDRIFAHQVSVPFRREMLDSTAMPHDKVEHTVEEYGNMAAASIPVALALAEERGAIGPGDRVMLVGMASGISVGVLVLEL